MHRALGALGLLVLTAMSGGCTKRAVDLDAAPVAVTNRGHTVALVTYTLTNRTASSILPTVVEFSAVAEDGSELALEFSPSVTWEGNVWWLDVTPDASATNTLVFTLDDKLPVRLYFHGESADASTDLTYPPCDWCGFVCTDLLSDPTNCGKCGVHAASCANGVPVCSPSEALCAEGCTDLLSSGDHCGSCDHSCAGSALGNPRCEGGKCVGEAAIIANNPLFSSASCEGLCEIFGTLCDNTVSSGACPGSCLFCEAQYVALPMSSCAQTVAEALQSYPPGSMDCFDVLRCSCKEP